MFRLLTHIVNRVLANRILSDNRPKRTMKTQFQVERLESRLNLSGMAELETSASPSSVFIGANFSLTGKLTIPSSSAPVEYKF